MKVEYIVGFLLLAVVTICGTILLSKRLEIAFRERLEERQIASDERNKREQIRQDSAANNWANLYQDEHEKRLELEQVNRRLQKQVEIANQTLAKIKVADL